MEIILLVGHGSPKKDANNIEHIGRLLHNTIHPECTNDCVRAAYLQFAKPGIMEAIEECVQKGVKRMIIHPYFLSSGMHVTKDIPEIIRRAGAAYPDVEFIYTEPLGIHNKLAQVVLERISAASDLLPADIEKKSFKIITEETDLNDITPEKIPIVKRVIHATADFEFKNSLVFHPDAIKAGLTAIKAGKDILTDVEMVKAGVIKRWLEPWGGKVMCNISDKDVIRESEKTGRTRAEIAMEKALSGNNNIGVIAIGNAPTALLKVIEIFNNSSLITARLSSPKSHHSSLVIGVPVGFVKAVESKALLATQDFPFITNLSKKGGSPVAVAIVNALLKMSGKETT